MIKLIVPNPYLEQEYTTHNLTVYNDIDQIQITPIKNGNYWISFAISKGFKDTQLSSKYCLVIKGVFNDNISVQIDNQSPVFLLKGVQEYTLPVYQANSKSIIFKGTLDQSFFIERLAIQHKFYRPPLKKKNIHFITDPSWTDQNKWRQGERHVLDYLNIIDTPSDNDIVYVRPVAELVTADDFKQINNRVQELKKNPKVKIINDISCFYNHNIKNFTFDIWTSNNIPHPEYKLVHSISDIYDFVSKYDNCIMRLNNSWGGQDSYCINNRFTDETIQATYSELQQKKHINIQNGFEHTDIIIVRKISPVVYNSDNILTVGRSYVVNKQILNSHAYVHKLTNTDQLTGTESTFEDFVTAHEIIRKIEKQHKELIINSVTSVGLQVGCVDYLIEKHTPIFLEVNAFWGMGTGSTRFPHTELIRDQLIKQRNNLRGVIPSVYDRMDEYNFWKRFYELL